MDNPPPGCEAFDDTIVFLSFFKDLHDPRQRGKVCYPLDEILLLCLLAVLAGAETITDIALFGVKKRELLRRFRSATARPRMITLAISWPRWMPSSSSAASPPGSRRSPGCRRG